MKSPVYKLPSRTYVSQPARAVWIEILNKLHALVMLDGHSLRGLCGLKFMPDLSATEVLLSQPARAVWIEITTVSGYLPICTSQPARAVWIEIFIAIPAWLPYWSQPARAVWIEINLPSKINLL